MNAAARAWPAEWAPQSGVMLTWPHAATDWAPRLAETEPVFGAIAREVSLRECVLIVHRDAAHRAHIERLLADAGAVAARVVFAEAPSNDTWARDHGPITVSDHGAPRLLDFGFNGWGGKYAADLDDAITRRLAARGTFGAVPCERVDMVLEGGSIESDGMGTVLTTRTCLLSPRRNPHLDRAGIEARLKAALGATRVLWLAHGHLAGDDTDAHVDTLARFCDPRTIAYVHCDDPDDEHYGALAHMQAELRALRAHDGTPYRLIALPWPRARFDEHRRRLPATYANFLIINDAVLVPTYRDPADAVALARLAPCFPGRRIVGIDCLPLIYQYGSLHCVSMQLPAGVLAGSS